MVKNIQKLRLIVQVSVLLFFLLHGFLYYLADYQAFGNLLPFMAFDSIGKQVISSALIAWIFIAISTIIFGRIACGWFCPFGLIQDLGEKLLIRFGIKLPKPKQYSRLVRLALLAMVLFSFIILPLLSASVVVWQFDLNFHEPWLVSGPFIFWLFVLDLLLIFLVLGLLLPYLFGPRPYCKMVCETGFLLEQFSKNSFGRIRRNEGFDVDTCIECEKCNKICPQAISIHEEVALFDKVVDSECITCLQCIQTCPNDTIVYSLAKKVNDTGAVSGYLSAQKHRMSDLKRFALVGVFIVLGGFLGFWILPNSYIHTYLLLASVFAVLGYYLYRIIFTEDTIFIKKIADVDKKLSKKERMKLQPKEVNHGVKRGVLVTLGVSILLIIIIFSTLPERISKLEELGFHENAFVIGVPMTLSNEEMSLEYKALKNHLEEQTALEIKLVTATTYSQLAFAIEDKRVDLAFLPPLAYLSLRQRAPKSFRLLAVKTTNGKTRYSAIIASNEKIPLLIKPALIGSKIAFKSPDSLSGFVEAQRYINALGLSFSDFKEVVFTNNHSKSLALLASKKVDFAATFDEALAVYEKKYDRHFHKLVINDSVPNDVVVSNIDVNESIKSDIVKALTSMKVKDINKKITTGYKALSRKGD